MLFSVIFSYLTVHHKEKALEWRSQDTLQHSDDSAISTEKISHAF